MAKISLAGFKDPVRRPRFIIWTFVVVLVLAAVVVIALGATSTRWFCAQVCHKVQDDTIAAYEASAHSEISCMACHEPVNANTVVFVLAKMKALGELYLTVTSKYELPLNEGSALVAERGGDGRTVLCPVPLGEACGHAEPRASSSITRCMRTRESGARCATTAPRTTRSAHRPS